MAVAGLSLALCAAASPAGSVSDRAVLRQSKVQLRYAEYEFALQKSERGVPTLDWQRYRSRPVNVVTRSRDGIILENAVLRATLIPDMGRLHSLVHKPSGKEQLWINPTAIPIPAHNDTGFWVTWGGVECVLPRGEHGTSHALRWQFKVEEERQDRRAVRMWSVEPLTGLQHTVTYRIYPRRPYLETLIQVRNPGREAVRFSHWTTALLAPGGRGEVTPRTEFIVPAERFVAADRPFNRWMQSLLGPTTSSPLRFMKSWRDIGDLMATPLTRPYYAAYSHEEDVAIVRTLDLTRTPGFNIWTWGYPPGPDRQKEYTAVPPNRGYVEFWNGTAKEYSDEARGVIRPGKTISWVERMWVLRGLKGKRGLRAEIERRCAVR
jgi:hypothetical protein